MDHFISDDVREECRKYKVEIFPKVSAGLWTPRRIGIESPCRLGDGVYDIDLIGAFSYLGMRDSRFYSISLIGRFCAIGSNVQVGHAEHPTDFLSVHPLFQGDPVWSECAPDFVAQNHAMIQKSAMQWGAKASRRFGKVTIGNDVWIGEGAFIRRGVEIGDGAIIGARAVVVRDVPPYAIVAGSPATVIRYRFDPAAIQDLLQLEWWLYGLSALDGVDFTDIGMAISRISQNISSGRAQPYESPVLDVGVDSVNVLHFDRDVGLTT